MVGFLTLTHHFPPTSEITWMAVHADHRGQGIGRALIGRLTDQLRREGRRLLLVTLDTELARNLEGIVPTASVDALREE